MYFCRSNWGATFEAPAIMPHSSHEKERRIGEKRERERRRREGGREREAGSSKGAIKSVDVVAMAHGRQFR